MTYRDNVSALAEKLGISNDPSLREEELGIEKLVFVSVENGAETNVTIIDATDMNRGGRLFFQGLATITVEDEDRMTELTCSDDMRQKATRYFAELWEENPVPGKRKLLDAIRDTKNNTVEIFWKQKIL